MSTHITLTVTGMTCGGCENAVTRALLRADGVEAARASHTDNRVEVDFDPEKVTLDALKAKIAGLGYAVAP